MKIGLSIGNAYYDGSNWDDVVELVKAADRLGVARCSEARRHTACKARCRCSARPLHALVGHRVLANRITRSSPASTRRFC